MSEGGLVTEYGRCGVCGERIGISQWWTGSSMAPNWKATWHWTDRVSYLGVLGGWAHGNMDKDKPCMIRPHCVVTDAR